MDESRHSHLRWSYLSTISTAGMQLLASATITRFLQPRDYGLAAMAMLCASMANYFTQLGMGRAIIQKPGLTEGNIRAAFSLSLATGFGGFILLSALSPLLALYFREPRLTPIIIAFGLSLIFQASSGVAGGLLRREFRIRDLAICDFLGYLLSTFGLGLPLAMKGFGVWALVASNVSQPLIGSIAYHIARPHPMKPTFKRADYRHIGTFGGKASFTTSIEALGGSLDTILMGRLVSPTLLGIYNRSLTLSTQPGYSLSMGLTRVFHPTIARAAERSLAECHKILTSSERQLMALILPFCAGAGVAAPTVIPVIFGRQWTSAVPVFQVLCVVAALDASYHLPNIQLEVLSLFRRKLLVQITFALAFGAGVLLVAHKGIVAVALVYAGLEVIRTNTLHLISARSLKSSYWSLVSSWIPGLICAFIVGFFLYFTQKYLIASDLVIPVIRLAMLIALAGATTVAVYRLLYRTTVYQPWISLFRRQSQKVG
ncbi:oligosaccharide flippase family protein [Acidipila rosea]|uniref:O-antigen/teichoic acid export membrane protein n=1 Tax=Acidipila rosea TaxID=768535 RepID=A0A4R1L3R3_9BACT|nr:oligosaccharide flippase family protein [Acidipila rosea]TCK72688.1 O-antigen/teichoic acid export membrane protein [Acidipila rosea]